MITKEEWVDWKSSHVTKAFFQACQERVEDTKELLSSSAGLEPTTDNFYRGFIHAYKEIQDFTIDFESTDEN